MDKVSDNLLTPRDVQRMLRVSLPYIKLAEKGQISCVRWDCPGKGERKKSVVRFKLEDIRQFVEDHYQKST
jgi:hypothetical protein